MTTLVDKDAAMGSATTITTVAPPGTGQVHVNRRQSIAASTIADNMTMMVLLKPQEQAKERRIAQRRCIAEDPDWNLALVEKLTDLCVKDIVANFEHEPYWKRRSTRKFKNCDIPLAEAFTPKRLAGLDEIEALERELKIAAPFVERLVVRQMKPSMPSEGEVVKSTDQPPIIWT
ncbi:hypothetical protein BC829DRAFT_443667 [Chytridium lagenaria]|nr:hypothetical protein BC829DRAFT_443667 [Chytridium lagenaria]